MQPAAIHTKKKERQKYLSTTSSQHEINHDPARCSWTVIHSLWKSRPSIVIRFMSHPNNAVLCVSSRESKVKLVVQYGYIREVMISIGQPCQEAETYQYQVRQRAS
jgi:hypothetical protein